MCIYLFTWMLLKLLLGQPTTYNVHPQENINLQFQGYVSKQNAKNFDDQNLNDQSLELLKEINFDPQQSFELIGNERLFSFQLNENEDIEIILLRDKSIECLFEVKNYLQDYEINMKKVECSILLNHTDCFQLHKLDSQNFIVQCNEQNNTIISVVNSQEVTDQIIIPIQSLCQSDSRLNNQTLIVFNKNCLTTTLYLVEIYNLGFNDFQEYNLTEIEGFLENSQEIVNVEFNNQKSLYLVYTNSIYAFYIKSKLISIIYEISGLQIKQIISYNNISIKYIIQENLETKYQQINYFYCSFILINRNQMQV